jgi:pimeloyl-ACP methyl ester carboxylesterase
MTARGTSPPSWGPPPGDRRHTGDDLALVLPGWGTDPARLHPLVGALLEREVDARTFSYRPVGTLESVAAPLVRAVATAEAERIHLVGHSLGGVLAAVASLADPRRVATVTTINTPWRGTWVARTGQGRLASALAWGSQDLLALRDRLALHTQDMDGPAWLLLSVLGDLATPATTALRSGSRGPRITRRIIGSAGHSTSLASPRLHAAVVAHVAGHGRLDAAS